MNRQEIHPTYEAFIAEYKDRFTDKEYKYVMKNGDYSNAESTVDSLIHKDDCFYSLFESYQRKTVITCVLIKCQKLRHKISVLNRRLQRVRTENKRLQKRNEKLEELLLDYVARQIPD